MNAKVFGPLFSRVGILPAVAAQDAAVLTAWADAAVDAGVPALELFLRGEGAEAAVTAAIANGTCIKFSSTLRAVTVISSS